MYVCTHIYIYIYMYIEYQEYFEWCDDVSKNGAHDTFTDVYAYMLYVHTHNIHV